MNGLLKQAAMTALLATAAGGAFAASGTDGGNPYSPAYGHPYRHGVIPDLQVNKLIKKWNATHLAPAVTNSKTLSYGGGVSGVGVLNGHAKVYLVFYGTQWGTQTTDAKGDAKFSGDSYGAAGVAQEMFKGIGTGNELWSAELTQWCQGISNGATSCSSGTPASSFIPYQSGGVLAGVWYDNTQASPSSATAAQLGNEAIAAAAHFGNTTASSNRYAYYVILSPHGTNPDSYQNSYCAWHDYTADAGVSSPYGEMAFSNQPYNMDSGSGCGVGFVNSGSAGNLDGWTMTLGHEWHEMMSDQFPAGGWTNKQGGTYNGQENSDECAWIAAGQTGGAANVTMGNGTYTEQASWSNDTNSCAISHAIVGGGSNVPPVANFSFTTNGLAASFTDSSTDSDGSISSRSWTFGDGGTSTSTNPSHTYAASGTYSVSLTVTDNGGATNTKTSSVTVTSSNVPPVANFSFVTNALVANFTDNSSDSDGTIASRSWNFGDGGTSTATNPSHTYAAGGTYSVSLTVTDNGGATNTKTSSVTVVGSTSNVLSNGVPVTGLAGSTGNQVNYTMVVPAGATNLKFVISGGTGDADLYVKFGSAPTLSSYDCRPYVTGNSETCTISNVQAGTYYVMLNAYATYSGVSLVGNYSVPSGNIPPTANFTFSASNLVVSFTDTSTDSDGTIASRSWNFGDGGTSTSANPGHTYASAGTYSVALTVTDNGGATNTKTQSVTVTSGGGGGNVLSNGVPVTGLAATTGNQLNYTMVVPAGATSLSFAISGGSGDADLYVKFGSAPTLSSYDCRPYVTGNSETCTITSIQAGTYYVMLNSYASFSGVSLVGTYGTSSGGGDTMQNGVPITGLSASTNNFTATYMLTVPAGQSVATFTISGNNGDADLYVRIGSAPTTSSYNCRPYLTGDNETCTFNSPTAGTYYVSVRAYATFSGVTLTGSYSP